MNQVQSVQPSRLPLLPAQPAPSRLALLRQQREQRRQRARWLSGLLLALGLAFVAQGFVREPAGADDAVAKNSSSRAARPADSSKPRAAQPQAAATPPVRH